MAGYSGTPLAQKLGIKPGHVVLLVDAPDGFEQQLGELPEGVRLQRDGRGKAPVDVLVVFTPDRAALSRRFVPAAARMKPAAGLWIAWPKKASGVATDLTENVVRDVALAAGLVDNKVCAIDEIWSGLRLVVRLQDRPAGAARGR